jgi:hypothetical protein
LFLALRHFPPPLIRIAGADKHRFATGDFCDMLNIDGIFAAGEHGIVSLI